MFLVYWVLLLYVSMSAFKTVSWNVCGLENMTDLSSRLKTSQHLSEFDQRLFPGAQTAVPRTKFLQSKHPPHYRCCFLHTCIGGLAEHRHFDFLMNDCEIDRLRRKKLRPWKLVVNHSPRNDSTPFFLSSYAISVSFLMATLMFCAHF